MFFALGLMSKPMVVTLPMVLLLLDYWPLQRREPVGKRLAEKLPFLALSLIASVVAVWAQQSVGAAWPVPLAVRLENALVSYVTYIEKFVWPVNLAIDYPYPISIPIWQWGGAALVLGGISWAVISGMRKRRYLGVGWFWFLGTLVPVIGLVQVGTQPMADRYTYLPYIGLALMVSWGLADLAGVRQGAKVAFAGFAAVALGCCLGATSLQVESWRDSMALYEHAIKVTRDNYLAHKSLGLLLAANGQLDEALKHFREVIRLHPGADTFNNVGRIYVKQGKSDEATPMFAKAIALDSSLIETQQKLAGALIRIGKTAEALPYCEAVAQARPDDAQAHFALGEVCLVEKRPEEAVANFKKTLQLAPDSTDCMNALAWIYATCAKPEMRNGSEAVRLATKACQMTKPLKPGMLDTLGAAYAEAGRFPDAINTAESGPFPGAGGPRCRGG